MRVLVTGATGFLGKAYILYLLSNNLLGKSVSVCGISSGRTQFPATLFKEVHYESIDLTKPYDHSKLNGLQFDCLVHLATSSTLGTSMSNNTRMNEVIDVGRTALKIAKATNCRKVIWASSGAVYKRNITIQKYSENENLKIKISQNERPYAAGKIFSELNATYFCENNDMSLTILRLFAFSGLGLPLDKHFALGNFVSDARLGNPITINGTGKATRSYLDQYDFARALHKVVVSENSSGIFNLGSGKAVTLENLAQMISELSKDVIGKDINLNILNKLSDSENFYVPNVEKFNSTFEFNPCVPLETSITEMLKSGI